MSARNILSAIMLAFLAVGSLAKSQTFDPAMPTPMPTPQSQSMESMNKMSDSVTKMSEMCQMMMQKEMAAMPYKIAVGVLIGILLFIALVLFIVLEVQWIKYWSRLLKGHPAEVRGPPKT